MDKTENPSEAKILELKSQGIIAYSSFASENARNSGIFATLYFYCEHNKILMRSLFYSDFSSFAIFIYTSKVLFQILILPLIFGIISYTVFGLIQTKLLIQPSKAIPRLKYQSNKTNNKRKILILFKNFSNYFISICFGFIFAFAFYRKVFQIFYF